MPFVFHRIFVITVASLAVVVIGSSCVRSDERVAALPQSSSESNATDLAELSSIVIPPAEPLDLSELLQSLGEVPALQVAFPGGASISKTASETASIEVQLVGANQPIVIGSSGSTQSASPSNPGSASNRANPLRSGTEKSTKTEASAELPLPTKPSSDDAPLEPLTLPLDEDEIATKLSDAKPEPAAAPATPPPRPRPKMVEVKPITADEQESPRLTDVPREIDAKQAREEDAKAIIAKRPEAAAKTFLERPSTATGRIASEAALSSIPVDAIRAKRVENCLAYYMANPESVVERSPWAVMHAMLPFGVEGEIMVANKRVNSIQWMCYNGTCRTQKLFTPAGKYFRPNVGGGVQGHEGQFLAMLAQSQVSASYPIVVGRNQYSVTDLIRYEMATCKERAELTFKLIGLSYYVDTDQTWVTDRRSRWSIEKLVQEELAQPINGAACGGTHRLMGLTFAVRQRKAEGRPIDGHFARADRYVKDFVEYAWTLQNPDGSFSTNWFESRGNDPNMERKVQTTGHILEWLAFTVPDEELSSARFNKSVDFLLSQIWDQRQRKWPIGPRGHATRAVAIFHQRTTGVSPGQRQSQLAEQIQSLRSVR